MAADDMEKRAAHADALMRQRVTAPAFFEKAAAYGVTPPDRAAAEEMWKVAEIVCPAVARALQRELSAGAAAETSVIKAAGYTARALAGALPGQPAETPAGSFLRDPDVSGAAAVLVAEQIKRAGLADLMAPKMGPKKTKEEEEDEEEALPAKAPPMTGAS
jgi:hypothetical protein